MVLTSQITNYSVMSFAKEKSEEPKQTELYAKSAVLIDADSGRVLYEKNGNEAMPMASTTKIMTLILVLENANLNDTVTVSKNAAKQPKVHLGMRANQQFKLSDLCYSLMLESHNDSAVALAEHVGGSVEGFAKMMNAKARDIGCTNTYFITPNGLDSQVTVEGKIKIHSTTATELAKIMRYCIQLSPCKEKFLEITRTASYSFTDIEGKSTYSCNNHNAFLSMMEGALSGKTGFTGKAGYCYIGALERDERTYIVALLACGWPNNKTYKWSDTRKLMEYGIDNYECKEIYEQKEDFEEIPVENGCMIEEGKPTIWKEAKIQPVMKKEELSMLLKEEEEIKIEYKLETKIQAPVKKNDIVGKAEYYLGNEKIKVYNIYSCNEVVTFDLELCVKQILEKFFV
ncbi:MAG: D-alanyl-D-alanine carboxypeptidase [Lachnospiraceae bacterium]|nr:D-alanyl-D-alanine carboxypeptidase [Lachnospiraceae bacterium]